MKILVLGSGGREHALTARLRQDGAEVVCAPGNAGVPGPTDDPGHPRPALDPCDPSAVLDLVDDLAPDLVVVGPEAPLVAGVADAVRAAGTPCFGPSAVAAQIEASKTFAKAVMAEAGVPTASSQTFESSLQAVAHLADAAAPYVVKADGLAGGKGVHVGSDLHLAQAFARDVTAGGGSVLIEHFLDGPEVSLFAVTDGTTVVPLLPARDHKRVGDGDTGPNTGGMGAYAPVPLPAGWVDGVRLTVLQPVVDTMRERGTPFQGLLYAGLALTSSGVKVIEFNARFGDPETQAVLALMQSSLAELLLAAATGTLASVGAPVWRDGAAVTVVVAAQGYPVAPVLGGTVTVGALPGGVTVQHAGTRSQQDGQVVASGGRVLTVTAVGTDLEDARAKAYEGISAVSLEGSHHRTDIGLSPQRAEGPGRLDP